MEGGVFVGGVAAFENVMSARERADWKFGEMLTHGRGAVGPGQSGAWRK